MSLTCTHLDSWKGCTGEVSRRRRSPQAKGCHLHSVWWSRRLRPKPSLHRWLRKLRWSTDAREDKGQWAVAWPVYSHRWLQKDEQVPSQYHDQQSDAKLPPVLVGVSSKRKIGHQQELSDVLKRIFLGRQRWAEARGNCANKQHGRKGGTIHPAKDHLRESVHQQGSQGGDEQRHQVQPVYLDDECLLNLR